MATVKSFSAASQPLTLRRSVFNLALPAVGEQVLNTLVGLSDTFLVGHLSMDASRKLGYDSATALAGVGLANQMVWLVTVFFIAVSVGSTALIARHKGANEMPSANRVLQQSLLIGLAMGLAATMAALLLAPASMRLLGAGPDVLPLGVAFFRIAGLTFAPAALLFVGNAALRGVGDTRTPLLVMLGVNGVNILLSWLLVNGNLGMPTLGVEGSAVGAAVARGGGGLFLVWLLLRGRSGLQVERRLRVDWSAIKRIVKIGAPSGGEQIVFQGALLIFIGFVTSLGTVAYAAHNVVLSIESLSFLPGLGYAVAASALVGQRLGAGEPDAAQDNAYEALRQGALMMTTLGVIMILFPHQLITLFVNDPDVAAMGANSMRIAGLFQPFLALNFILSGALRGAGDTRFPMYSKLVTTWGIRLPLVFGALALGWGLTGIWAAMTIDFAAQSLLALWRFRQNRWRSIRV
ncbi:MAG TPA: MATE family efflux transporter [Roseiflexaceae bacterium]|jgi:putative MATE family efflux protein|nr:MATE family efflux transporter [Roseiflexaceae bacterium]